MKKFLIILLIFLLCSTLLPACSQEEVPENTAPPHSAEAIPSEAPEEAPVSTLDLKEENAVDDSYSFSKAPEIRPADYFREEILPEYLDRWVDDAEIVEVYLADDGLYPYSLSGWVLFRGTAKPGTNWRLNEIDGEELYCRSIYLKTIDRLEWHVNKSSPLLPCYFINLREVSKALMAKKGLTEESAGYLELPDLTIKGLESAELYVHELSECFSIRDSDSLRALEHALSATTERSPYVEPAPFAESISECERFNPLFLHFENGETRLVLTHEAGSCGTNIWATAGSRSFRGPKSIYELFSVPLEAKGYKHNADGSTLITTSWLQHYPEHNTPSYGEALYNAEGKLTYKTRCFPDEDNKYREIKNLYYYDDNSRLIKAESYFSGELSRVMLLEYNSSGILVKRTDDRLNGNVYCLYYDFDDMGRLIALRHEDGEGNPALPSSNTYFWYDGQGNQFEYSFNPDGSYRGTPPDAPVRRAS